MSPGEKFYLFGQGRRVGTDAEMSLHLRDVLEVGLTGCADSWPDVE